MIRGQDSYFPGNDGAPGRIDHSWIMSARERKDVFDALVAHEKVLHARLKRPFEGTAAMKQMKARRDRLLKLISEWPVA